MTEKKLEQHSKEEQKQKVQKTRRLEQLKKYEERFDKEHPVWLYKVKCG